MLTYSKAVAYTVMLTLLFGVGALWMLRDPSISQTVLIRMTLGGILLIAYLMYRHVSCVQHISIERDHIYMGRTEDALQSEVDYKMAYRSTFLVFSGFRLLMREWRPETGMIVFRKTSRYVPFMSLFDRIFPTSGGSKQVLFFGAWKRPSGEVVPDGEIQNHIQTACLQSNIIYKTIWIELELVGMALVIASVIIFLR